MIRNDRDATVMQGVANFRFLDKDAQNKVMQDIGKLDDHALRGQLQAKVADLKVQPEWVERSLTDEELRQALERNEGNAKVLTWIGAAPGPGGFAFDHYAKEFEKAVERIRVELTRRGLNKESH
jgi:hypothetical protein